MKFTRLVAVAVMMGALGVGGVYAQTTKPGAQPAEFPPASYKGKQYVDSRGCVFIRAGIDGTVSWIPRVARNRKGVCGFKPTLSGQTASAVPAPAPAEAPVQITNTAPVQAAQAEPAPEPVAVAPKPRAVVKPRVGAKPRPQVVRQTAPVRVVRKPQPVVVAQAPQPRVILQPAARTQPACQGGSAISSRYINSGRDHPVRCGSQTTQSAGVTYSAPAPVTVSPNARIVPKHVYIRRQNTTNVTVPRGYKKVWKDDRLNPRRAEQTIAGHQQMQLIWTSTVPRRLIQQATGRDLTASVALVYPFTDLETQQRELGQVIIVQREGRTVKRILRNRRAQQVVRQPTYSTRSVPQQTTRQAPVRAQTRQQTAPKAEALSGKRYVQVGTFGNPSNAQATAKNIQRMGLPVRIGKFTRSGQTLRVVVAGPFGSDGAMSKALNKVRGAGYRDAYARR